MSFLFIIAILAFIFVVVSICVFQQEEEHMSDLMLDNIEALAQGEGSGNYDCVAPYTIKCSQEGSVRVPGYRMDKQFNLFYIFSMTSILLIVVV